MVHAGQQHLTDDLSQRYSDSDELGTHARFGGGGAAPSLVIDQVADYIDRLTAIDALLVALRLMDETVQNQKGDQRGAS
ncbi:MAG: hypothetical protein IOD09_01500 [Rhodocyclaceae bacterium]|nr:hypothetical protein [Rhodocyclaceae bacterium]MCA4904607.1 hypothetical protein [Rhodocyclaceae bacterium]